MRFNPWDAGVCGVPGSIPGGSPGRRSGGLARVVAKIGTLLGATLAVAGCVLDAEKPDLALDIPNAYREVHGATEGARPALDWWRQFRSPELTSLVEQASTANLDIAVAIAQIQQADAQVRISGAALLPTLDYNASDTATKSSQQLGSSSGSGAFSPYSRTYSNSLTASYIVDFWGKNRDALLAAQETAVGSRYNREVVTLTAITTVATTYFNILAAQDRLKVARHNLADASRILFLIQQQFSAGTQSDLNVAQQESLVETVRATIPPLEETLRQNIAALAVLVGKPPERFNTRGSTLAALARPRITPGLPSELLNQRPDIRQAEQALKASNYSVESARAAFFPTIQLTGTLGFESAALRSLFGPGAWFYTAAAGLTQPIFDGGVLLGQLELQKGLQLQNLQTYRKSVLSAFSNVEQSLIAVEQTAAQERIQENVVKASRRAFVLSEQQMTGGTINMVTLLQTEQTLFSAEDTLAVDRLAHLTAIVSLFQALGGGWPPKVPTTAGPDTAAVPAAVQVGAATGADRGTAKP